MNPADLPKAPEGATCVLISGKTWQALCQIVAAGWPLAGNGIAINQKATGRAVRLLGELTDHATPAPTLPEATLPPPPNTSGSGSTSSPTGGSSGSTDSANTSPASRESESSSPSSASIESGSSKAIVPAAGKWIAWHCNERRTVDFIHVLKVQLKRSSHGLRGKIQIPLQMIECCTPGTLQITSHACPRPTLFEFDIRGHTLHCQAHPCTPAAPTYVHVKIRGHRKGAPHSPGWTPATQAEHQSNSAAWRSLATPT